MTLNVAGTLTKEEIAGLSVDDLLDVSADQLSEVTAYVPKPTAVYNFAVKSVDLDEAGDGHAIAVVYNLTDCVELNDEAEADLVGELPAEYKELYFIGGESDFGIRTFRTIFAGVVPDGTSMSIREMMEAAVGVTGQGLLKHNKWKSKETGEIKEGNKWEATTVALG